MAPGARTIVCYVTDRRDLARADRNADSEIHSQPNLERAIERAIRAGVDWIQIREKDLEARALEAIVRRAVQMSAGRARIIVNGRLDVALAAGAAGVHLGEASLPVGRVAAWRSAAGQSELVIGASCHSAEGARVAEQEGADYIFFGPIFSTPSKKDFGEPQELARLADICKEAQIPVLAIGGINESDIAACLEAGAAGIAAIRMFQGEGDLGQIVRDAHASRSTRHEKNFGGI